MQITVESVPTTVSLGSIPTGTVFVFKAGENLYMKAEPVNDTIKNYLIKDPAYPEFLIIDMKSGCAMTAADHREVIPMTNARLSVRAPFRQKGISTK